jgi:nitroreductase
MKDKAAYDNFLKVVKKRRSVRYLKPDPMPEKYISKIIEAARWAPSGFHTQPWEFLVVKKKAIRDKIIDILEPPITPEGTKAERPNAPVIIIALIDWRAKVGLPDAAQKNEAMLNNIYCSSMAGAFLLMHLAATSLGLASRWYSSTSSPKTQRLIKDIIGIPEELTIYDTMCVGYPERPPIPKIVRELNDMIHYDNCGPADFRTKEQVEAYARETRVWCLAAH